MDVLKQLLDKFLTWFSNRTGQERKNSFRIGLVLLWVVGTGLLVWLIWRYWGEILPYLMEANPLPLIFSFVSFLFSILAATIGWTLVMKPFSPKIRWWMHARIYAATLIARRLPGTLWYVGGRLILYGNAGIPKSFVAFASGLEMVLFVASGVLIGLVLLPQLPAINFFIALVITAAAVSLWFSPNLIAYFMKKRGIEAQRTPTRLDLAGWILAYSANSLFGGLMVFNIISAFTVPAMDQIPYILGAWAFSGAMGTLTIFLPSTFGIVEISLSVLLSRILPLPLAAVVAIMVRLLTYLFDFLIAAALYPFMRKSFQSQGKAAEDPISGEDPE